MPVYLDDIDVIPELEGLHNALIVPCNMCPAVTVAIREKKPFLRLYRSWFKSAPFQQHIKNLRSQLTEKGIQSKVFKSNFYPHWFMCMWTTGHRKKLKKQTRRYDAMIVLGCTAATETVRAVVKSSNCKVVEGMKVIGMMNARMQFHMPGNVSFVDCETIPLE